MKAYVAFARVHVADVRRESNIKVRLDSKPVGTYKSREDVESDRCFLEGNRRWQKPLTLTAPNGDPLRHKGFQVEELKSGEFAIVCEIEPP